MHDSLVESVITRKLNHIGSSAKNIEALIILELGQRIIGFRIF